LKCNDRNINDKATNIVRICVLDLNKSVKYRDKFEGTSRKMPRKIRTPTNS